MEEVIRGIKHQLNERVSSPLFASFLISWCLWNYKFLVILISKAPVSKTFELINTVSFPDAIHVVIYGIVAPAMTSFAYIFLYPIPAKFVFEYSLKKQREILEIKQKIENETPLTIEQSRQIRLAMSKLSNDHDKELERKDQEIAKLKNEIESLTKPKQSQPSVGIRKAAKGPADTLTMTQRQLLAKMADAGGVVTARAPTDLPPADKIQYEFDIGELKSKALIESSLSGSQPVHRLTHSGKGLVLKMREDASRQPSQEET